MKLLPHSAVILIMGGPSQTSRERAVKPSPTRHAAIACYLTPDTYQGVNRGSTVFIAHEVTAGGVMQAGLNALIQAPSGWNGPCC